MSRKESLNLGIRIIPLYYCISKPKQCMFPVEVKEVLLTEVVELDLVTEEAKKSIKSVPVRTAPDEED